MQIVEQTWNYYKGAYDQAPAPQSLTNLKSLVDDYVWGPITTNLQGASQTRPHSI